MYALAGPAVERKVVTRSGIVVTSTVQRQGAGGQGESAEDAFDRSWLRATTAPPQPKQHFGDVRVVDLFAGCGGLSLGVWEACRALGLKMSPILAVDTDQRALDVYSTNFPAVDAVAAPVESLLDGTIGSPVTLLERELLARTAHVDMLIGGPPCQGHSDLNNHTRRSDPRNELYLRMARFCEVAQPAHVIIENVPGVLRDKSQAAQRTWGVLEKLGYSVATGTINASVVGVAQSRRRNLTIASRSVEVSEGDLFGAATPTIRSLSWAIEDLQTHYDARSVFDSAPVPDGITKKRIDFLFDEDVFDLPNAERPDCHRLKPHTYVSNYGRMHPDRPAQTITTGFGVMGKGRFVHPRERRTITPHEAARIQFFPDFFRFPVTGRIQLQKLIGNAVPSKLGYAIGMNLLR